MQEDLRGFLERLVDLDLITYHRELTPAENVAALMQEQEKRAKAIVFQDIEGFSYPLVYNVLGSRELLSLALNCPRDAVVEEFIRRSAHPIAPVLIAEAPVQEVVLTGIDIDVTEFPSIVHSEKDSGRYITAGMVIAKDPITGIRNVSINRMELRGKNKLGCRIPQQLGLLQQKAEQLSRPLEVAVAIGNHPLDLIAAVTSFNFGIDELGIAGALRGHALEVVKCKTVDLEVPATAEIVIEGTIGPEKEKEGPFGDFMGYYVPVMDNHVLWIKAITHRANPIFQTMKAGSIEDAHLLGISREASVYSAVKATGSKITGVSLCPMIFNAAIAIEKKFEDEARNVMMAAFGSYRWLKFCVVVDHDVDVDDVRDVWWAMATRCRPDRGILVIPDAVGFYRDPFRIHQSKVGIDATVPLNQWDEFARIRVPHVREEA